MPVQLSVATEILSCPPASAGGLAGAVRARGNVPVLVGPDCLFELTPDDIRETWQATSKLKAQVAGAMLAEIAHRLCEELSGDTEDPQAVAGDAAACLFLALRHHNVPLLHALAGCRITFDDMRRAEAVECLA